MPSSPSVDSLPYPSEAADPVAERGTYQAVMLEIDVGSTPSRMMDKRRSRIVSISVRVPGSSVPDGSLALVVDAGVDWLRPELDVLTKLEATDGEVKVPIEVDPTLVTVEAVDVPSLEDVPANEDENAEPELGVLPVENEDVAGVRLELEAVKPEAVETALECEATAAGYAPTRRIGNNVAHDSGTSISSARPYSSRKRGRGGSLRSGVALLVAGREPDHHAPLCTRVSEADRAAGARREAPRDAVL